MAFTPTTAESIVTKKELSVWPFADSEWKWQLAAIDCLIPNNLPSFVVLTEYSLLVSDSVLSGIALGKCLQLLVVDSFGVLCCDILASAQSSFRAVLCPPYMIQAL